MIGQTVSHYQVTEKLGEGGMGEVYRARDTKLNRDVALKILPPAFARDAHRMARFEREAQVLASLNHPHIAQIHGLEEADGTKALVLELVEGETLRERIKRGPIPFDEALEIALQICEGLEAAHGKGIVHRDLKPANIKITQEEQVKILDFGLAKRLAPADLGSQEKTLTALTRDGTTLGTVPYMSPEQLLGEPVDQRSDIFSFGVVLHELLTGVHPFVKTQPIDTARSILWDEPALLTEYLGEIPELLQHTVSKMLAKAPEKRYQSVREVRTNFGELLEDLTPSKRVVAANVAREARLQSRGMNWKVGFVAGLVLGLTLLSYLAWRGLGLHEAAVPNVQPDHKQITFVGDASSPAISPDGTYVAFVRRESGGQTVMVKDLLSEGEALEIFRAQNCIALDWSPRGAELALTAETDTEWQMVIVPRLGGPSRRTFPVGAISKSWSPDGSLIAYFPDGTKWIGLMNVSTGETKTISLDQLPFTWLLEVDWSPAGDLLLFLTEEAGSFTLWSIRTDGSEAREILREKNQLSSPKWAPDGEALYYLQSRGHTQDLMRMQYEPGQGPQEASPTVLLTGMLAGHISVSRDGKRLAYTREQESSNLRLASRPGSGEAAGFGFMELTAGTSVTGGPSISPDGERIAFSRRQGSWENIFIMPIVGGQAQQVTFFNSINASPAWSPDGKEIAFASTETGIPRVWKVRPEDGSLHQFSQSQVSSNYMCLTWAPGPVILYQREGNRNYHLLDPATEEETPLVLDDSVGFMFEPHFSPNGERVVVRWNRTPHTGGAPSDRAGLWIISLKDQEGFLFQAGEFLWPLGWSADGNWIYANDLETVFFPLTSARVVMANVGSGQVKPLLTAPGEFERAESMTPDGTRFVLVKSRSQSDIWLVENFDPAEAGSSPN